MIHYLLKTSFLISVIRAVGVRCTGLEEDLYTCKINRENQSTELKSCHKLLETKTDKNATAEYIENFNVRGNLYLIAANSLAFPKAKPHAGMIYRLLRQNRHVNLIEYLKQHDCVAESIITIEELRDHAE